MTIEMKMDQKYEQGRKEGVKIGRSEGVQLERENTEKERKRADDALKRATELEAEVQRLRAMLKK